MRKSRLTQHKQNKLTELFVADVTARTAGELVNVNKPYLGLMVKLKPMKAISVVAAKVSMGVMQRVKPLYSGF